VLAIEFEEKKNFPKNRPSTNEMIKCIQTLSFTNFEKVSKERLSLEETIEIQAYEKNAIK